MAQLKSTVVQGNLRVTDATYTTDIIATNIDVTTIHATDIYSEHLITTDIYSTDNLYIRTKWQGGTTYNTIASVNATSILPGSTSDTRTIGDNGYFWTGIYGTHIYTTDIQATDTLSIQANTLQIKGTGGVEAATITAEETTIPAIRAKNYLRIGQSENGYLEWYRCYNGYGLRHRPAVGG